MHDRSEETTLSKDTPAKAKPRIPRTRIHFSPAIGIAWFSGAGLRGACNVRAYTAIPQLTSIPVHPRKLQH